MLDTGAWVTGWVQRRVAKVCAKGGGITLAGHWGRRVSVHHYGDEDRARAKAGFTTRRVPSDAMRTLIGGSVRPRSGDVVSARMARAGQHRRIQRPNGRRAQLHVGDEILVTYGDRYAPDQSSRWFRPTSGRRSSWPQAESPR